MKYDTFIGVDPGANGAIAFMKFHDQEHVATITIPLGQPNVFWYNVIRGENDPQIYGSSRVALLEKVHAMPGQGVTSMFNFGRNYGAIEMALMASGVPFDYVTPQKWQKHFGLIKTKGETKTHKKNRHKALAQGLFPSITVTHTNADALLIAEYCRTIHS